MGPEAAAVQFVLDEPAERTRELIQALKGRNVGPAANRARVARQPLLGGTSLDKTMGLLREWQRARRCNPLARLVNSLPEVDRAVEKRSTHAELVWTGYRPPGSPLRSTSSEIR